MFTKKIAGALTAVFFIAGCGAPANSPKQAQNNIKIQEEKPSIENTQIREDSLEVSVKKMKAFMASNLDNTTSSSKTPVKDTVESNVAPIVIARGAFQNINYMTSGSAFLQKNGDQYYAAFEQDFKTPNGPDLRVYLTRNSGPTQRSDIKTGIDLGALQSLNGEQVYTIPPGTKIEDFHSISIHCKAFNVPWSYAALK